MSKTKFIIDWTDGSGVYKNCREFETRGDAELYLESLKRAAKKCSAFGYPSIREVKITLWHRLTRGWKNDR